MSTISITVNGAQRAFAHALNVAELIDAMQLSGKRIAIERNGAIVPRSRYRDETLSDGDQLEIVVAVGGG
jgi:sulfur carrier protein